ncbi:MAG: hypothetical protein JOS17DRAFT_582854 [Linnemannia elongata]|nr:MAG: hypothetical protein JOS17DRAFT_582854 [Linnemannia elongata]
MGSFVPLEAYFGVHPFSNSQRFESFCSSPLLFFSVELSKNVGISCLVVYGLFCYTSCFCFWYLHFFLVLLAFFLVVSVPYFRPPPYNLLLPFAEVCNMGDFSQVNGPEAKKKKNANGKCYRI